VTTGCGKWERKIYNISKFESMGEITAETYMPVQLNRTTAVNAIAFETVSSRVHFARFNALPQGLPLKLSLACNSQDCVMLRELYDLQPTALVSLYTVRVKHVSEWRDDCSRCTKCKGIRPDLYWTSYSYNFQIPIVYHYSPQGHRKTGSKIQSTKKQQTE